MLMGRGKDSVTHAGTLSPSFSAVPTHRELIAWSVRPREGWVAELGQDLPDATGDTDLW